MGRVRVVGCVQDVNGSLGVYLIHGRDADMGRWCWEHKNPGRIQDDEREKVR